MGIFNDVKQISESDNVSKVKLDVDLSDYATKKQYKRLKKEIEKNKNDVVSVTETLQKQEELVAADIHRIYANIQEIKKRVNDLVTEIQLSKYKVFLFETTNKKQLHVTVHIIGYYDIEDKQSQKKVTNTTIFFELFESRFNKTIDYKSFINADYEIQKDGEYIIDVNIIIEYTGRPAKLEIYWHNHQIQDSISVYPEVKDTRIIYKERVMKKFKKGITFHIYPLYSQGANFTIEPGSYVTFILSN